MGITLAILLMSGKIPSFNDKLHISLNLGEITPIAIFRSLVGIEEGPDDFESSREIMISLISWEVVGSNKSVWGDPRRKYKFLGSLRFYRIRYIIV